MIKNETEKCDKCKGNLHNSVFTGKGLEVCECCAEKMLQCATCLEYREDEEFSYGNEETCDCCLDKKADRMQDYD